MNQSRPTPQQIYQSWCAQDKLLADDRTRLTAIQDNAAEIEDCFYRDLEFGTGGVRGILGMGTNRMNRYTVRLTAQGLADYVKTQNGCEAGVVIGRDTRHFSDVFANETARVLAANGIKVYLFDTVHATPEVSFAVRYYKAAAGVMITASHNPKEYNGFKAYGADGGQFPPEGSDMLVKAMKSYDIFDDVAVIDDAALAASPLIVHIGEAVDEAFLQAVQAVSINPEAVEKVADDFKVVYTPFHGVGLRPVTEILSRIGVKHIIVEPVQAEPDPNFSSVKSPNPEEKEGFAAAIELAKKEGASLIIGTDPDADRVGVVVRDAEGEYQILTGNQIGALLCEYVLSAKQAKGLLTPKSTLINTVVTAELAQAIAEHYGAQIVSVLTGFKYIGEKIAEFEQSGSNVYEFGFEESYGYLPGTYARDKDAVGASMLIAEMAAVYQARGMTLYDALQELFEKYGYYREKTISVALPGKDGMEKMNAIMSGIRENMPDKFGDIGIAVKQDFLQNKQYNSDGTTCIVGDYPPSDVLKFRLEDGVTFVAIRPSGTEPKIKLYLGTAAPTAQAAEHQVSFIMGAVRGHLGV